jgi:hypothetical protein
MTIAPTTPAGQAPVENQDSKAQLIRELAISEKNHRWWASWDARWHQTLVIVAACAGFFALAAGLVWPDRGWIAGIIGAVPSLASLLIGQLHCVKAANWNTRKAQEAECMRYRLQYEGHDVARCRRIGE